MISNGESQHFLLWVEKSTANEISSVEISNAGEIDQTTVKMIQETGGLLVRFTDKRNWA